MDSPGTLNPELLVQDTRRLLSRISSPSLFVALDRPVSPRKKSDTGHQTKAATPIIIDLTGISDDGDDIPPSVPRRLLQDQFSQDSAPSELHRTTHSLVEDKTRGPPKLERLFPPVLTPEIPLIPDSTESTIPPREISTIPCHLTKLQPLNQEWIQHFRQRRRDQYRSPTRHTARQRLPVAKIQRAKRPLMKPKISTQRGRKKPVLHVRDVYEDFEASQRCNDERGSWSSTSQGRAEEENKLIYLPRIESCKVAMEDVKEFEKKESEFKDAFSQTIDHVLGKAEDDALAISFTSTFSQTERSYFSWTAYIRCLSGLPPVPLPDTLTILHAGYVNTGMSGKC
ncbi:hypothetical protein F5882DRAFT_379775 [Hyaloscypha sp. PMI_1271]|nr:hypothetical protein F5882DRAFT_379775 [Hyaloscypha sp. PMI_1271]